jgi:hypothetical protein
MKTPFYVRKKPGNLNGEYSHVVRIKSVGKILCAGNKEGCIIIARALSSGIDENPIPTESEVLA